MRYWHLAVLALFIASCGNEPSPAGSSVVSGSAASAADGKALFQADCATCHNPLKDATGPAMHGALGRWNNDTAKLFMFIRNPAKMISDGDPLALKAYQKFKPAVMTGFPSLSDAELNAILAFAGN